MTTHVHRRGVALCNLCEPIGTVIRIMCESSIQSRNQFKALYGLLRAFLEYDSEVVKLFCVINMRWVCFVYVVVGIVVFALWRYRIEKIVNGSQARLGSIFI